MTERQIEKEKATERYRSTELLIRGEETTEAIMHYQAMQQSIFARGRVYKRTTRWWCFGFVRYEPSK